MNNDDDDIDPDDTRTAHQLAISEGHGKRKSGEASKKPSSGHRCRRCGHEYASSQWKAYHENKISDISN